MSKIIVYGKTGCGKTTVMLPKLAAEYPGYSLLDDGKWDGKSPLPENSIALTDTPPPYAVDYDQLIEMT
jgi:hypothetical protein